ncbi:mCG140675, partial [Mus musculus]
WSLESGTADHMKMVAVLLGGTGSIIMSTDQLPRSSWTPSLTSASLCDSECWVVSE